MRIRIEAENAAVATDGERLAPPDAGRFDLRIAVPGGELRPGLINAHDHLHRNHYPRLGEPPYRDAYAWGLDLHDRWAEEIGRAKRLGRRDALLFGALKNLLGGATTVVHHDRWEGAFDAGPPGPFPVRVPRLRIAHSLRFESDLTAAVRGDRHTGDRPLCMHLAEGITPDAADEVREADRLDLLDDRLLAVHAVGVDRDGIDRIHAAGAAVVWCPTSNAFLFGRTAPRALLRSGVDVLLGTDALLTGEGTLLDELRAARRFGALDDDRLIDAVGDRTARRLGLPAPSLAPGAAADLLLLDRPLLGPEPDDVARPEDVALVVVDGRPRLADERFDGVFDRFGVPVDSLRVGDRTKLVAPSLARVVERVVEEVPELGRIFRAGPGTSA